MNLLRVPLIFAIMMIEMNLAMMKSKKLETLITIIVFKCK